LKYFKLTKVKIKAMELIDNIKYLEFFARRV